MHEYREQNNDRQRHSQQPQQRTSSKAHDDLLYLCLLFSKGLIAGQRFSSICLAIGRIAGKNWNQVPGAGLNRNKAWKFFHARGGWVTNGNEFKRRHSFGGELGSHCGRQHRIRRGHFGHGGLRHGRGLFRRVALGRPRHICNIHDHLAFTQ